MVIIQDKPKNFTKSYRKRIKLLIMRIANINHGSYHATSLFYSLGLILTSLSLLCNNHRRHNDIYLNSQGMCFAGNTLVPTN